MSWLVAGLALFFGVHLLPAGARLRARLIERLGENAYKGAFSVAAAAGLALMIFGFARSPHIALWTPPAWGAGAAAALMAPAFVLLAAANFRAHIKRATRHPLSLGVLLWAAGHLLANGDAASLLLFGGFAAFALFDMLRHGFAPPTGAPPPTAAKWDAIAVAIGIAAYIVLAAAHRALFGVAVIPAF